MFGIFPGYALLRLHWPPTPSYQLLQILLALLDYVVCLLVLRRFGVGPALAALGAFVFAFGSHRIGQLGHIQLFPVFYAPLCLLALRRLLAAPGLRPLALLLLLLYLQLLSGIYLGWFLILTVGILTPLLLAFDRDGRQRLVAWCRAAPRALAAAAAGLVALWAAACYLTLRPYQVAARQVGYRPWQEATSFLPNVRSWFSVPPGSVHERWLADARPESLPGVWELHLFPGLILLGLGALSLVWLLRQRRHAAATAPTDALAAAPLPADDAGRAWMAACWAAAAVLIALSLALPRIALDHGHLVRTYPGVSLWLYVYRFVPGAGGIRAVGRIEIMIYLLVVVAACCGAEAALRRGRLSPRARAALLAGLLVAGMAEQWVSDLRAAPVRQFFNRVAELRADIPPGCRLIYALLPPPESPRRSPIVAQLVAMWAGLESNVRVVNGYSGYAPPRYPSGDPAQATEEIQRWTGSVPCIVEER